MEKGKRIYAHRHDATVLCMSVALWDVWTLRVVLCEMSDGVLCGFAEDIVL